MTTTGNTAKNKQAASGTKDAQAAVRRRSDRRPSANDTLYHDLEQRYGGSFAQWILDNLDLSATGDK